MEILKKAKEHGNKIDLIDNYISEMVYHLDPNFLCSSTKTIREFFGFSTDCSHCPCIIVFRRLLSIEKLGEMEMFTVYLQCFSCKHHGKSDPSVQLTNSGHTGHFCLWKKGVRHGDINLGNQCGTTCGR